VLQDQARWTLSAPSTLRAGLEAGSLPELDTAAAVPKEPDRLWASQIRLEAPNPCCHPTYAWPFVGWMSSRAEPGETGSVRVAAESWTAADHGPPSGRVA
jgi:hypothetical protein